MYELGTGILNWYSKERISDRYGTVYLLTSLENEDRVRFSRINSGKKGRLIAIVKEIRQSDHIGDLYHGVFPKTPRVGQKITLGKGRLFFNDDGVGLKPDDGRKAQLLDIRALYKVHEQTVTLYFDEFIN